MHETIDHAFMMPHNVLIETDEAEIKAGMISKRVREGESRAEAQPVKWTAEGAVKGSVPSILRRGGIR